MSTERPAKHILSVWVLEQREINTATEKAFSPSLLPTQFFFSSCTALVHATVTATMRFWYHGPKLVFASLALTALAKAVSQRSPTKFGKRMWTGASSSSSSRPSRFTFDQLANGFYQYDHLTPPTYVSSIPSIWSGNYFHIDGKPIFRFRPDSNGRIKTLELDRAVVDFGGFHAHVSNSNRALTIARDPEIHDTIALLPPRTEQHVIDGAQRVEQTGRNFGQNVALLTHGFRVSRVQSRKRFGMRVTPPDPDWDKVWASEPVARGTDVGHLRQKLEAERFMRFTNSQGTSSIGVRALSDGRIEHMFRDMAQGRELFRPI